MEGKLSRFQKSITKRKRGKKELVNENKRANGCQC